MAAALSHWARSARSLGRGPSAVYTVRLAGHGRRGGKNSFEAELARRHVVQKNSRPGHPTTCGKAERFQQTMKKWLRAQPIQPSTLVELQALLDRFVDAYNHRRPNRSLPHRATPATLYDSMPCVILLVQDLQIKVVNAATGDPLRELVLDPNRDYPPTRAPKCPARGPSK